VSAGTLDRMALADDVHRFTVDEYVALSEAADLDRTELIDGVICDVSPEGNPHRNVAEEIFVRLRAVAGGRVHVAGSVRVSSDSLWNPDVYVERAATADALYSGAEDLVLVVEVSRTTHFRDLGPKLRGYAAAGIPAYWVVVPGPEAYALVHTEPAGRTYRKLERIELPGGVGDLAVEALWAGIADE
jgi:Uma2 family endonuclease